MATVYAWQQDDFAQVAGSYLPRLPAEEGVERMIDGVGDLLIRKKGKADVAKKKLLLALAKPSWLDAESGEMLS
jgi:hypothetical protein